MESEVEFLAVIHRALGSITSIRVKMGREGTGRSKGKQYKRKCCMQCCCLSYMGSRTRGIASAHEFETRLSDRAPFFSFKNKQTEA